MFLQHRAAHAEICLESLVYWVAPSNCSLNSLVPFVRIFWLWGSFFSLDKKRERDLACMHCTYHGVRNVYLISSKILQIGISVGKFSIINSEELHIGNLGGMDP